MYRTLTALVAPVLLLAAAGCVEPALKAEQQSPPRQPADPPSSRPQAAGGSTERVFERPAPTEAADDPRVVSAQAAAERITGLLSAAHGRLTEMRSALGAKAATEADLKTAAETLKSLTTSARADCDGIARAARDLRSELRYAARGYEAAGELYRERARTYREPALRGVTVRMADEFDRLAADVPRRARLTDEFLGRLADIQEFLAEADRCLSDTRAALAILSAGPDPVRVSPESKVFRQQLEVYLGVVSEYQKRFLAPPPAAPPAGKGPDVAPAPVTPPPGAEPIQVVRRPPRVTEVRTLPPPPPAPKPEPPASVPLPSVPPYQPRPAPTSLPRPEQAARGGTAGQPAPRAGWQTRPSAPLPVLVYCERCGGYHEQPRAPSPRSQEVVTIWR